MHDYDREHRPTPTFQESAKKFKPGPTAPPERDEDRPDMSGASRKSVSRAEHERAAAAMNEKPTRGGAMMPEGAPGTFKKMPGEAQEG